jgi:hypothetical protein
MSKRTKAIFAGTSNTMGLGLELEKSERFQDDEYLKNCKNIPPVEQENAGYDTYTEEDTNNQRKYRWPSLVCDYFKLEQININDPIKEYPLEWFGEMRQAVDIVFSLYDKKDLPSVRELLSETRYIFLEFGYIRWWEEQLHGVDTEFKWPSTPMEIDRFLKDKNIDMEKKQKAIDWLNNVNPIELWERTISRIKVMKESFPEIDFVLLSWGINSDIFNLEITKELSDCFVKVPQNYKSPNQEYTKYDIRDIGNFLDIHRLTIKDTVKAYNPKYKDKWLYEDYHANSKGHQIIANQIINKLQNETRGLYSI